MLNRSWFVLLWSDKNDTISFEWKVAVVYIFTGSELNIDGKIYNNLALTRVFNMTLDKICMTNVIILFP